MPGYGDPPKHTRFKKGQSGNPAGKPKKLPIIDELLADVLGEQNGTSIAKDILNALVKKAKRGDVRAAEVLFDRAYGKAKEKIEVSGGVKSYRIVPASTRKRDTGQ